MKQDEAVRESDRKGKVNNKSWSMVLVGYDVFSLMNPMMLQYRKNK